LNRKPVLFYVPALVVARTAPPTPSPILVPVEEYERRVVKKNLELQEELFEPVEAKIEKELFCL
jgi:hypothetical protein